MPKACRALFQRDMAKNRGVALALHGLQQMAKVGKAGKCSACTNDSYCTLKCKLCSNFYHHTCAASPESLYPHECKNCGKQARNSCLFCGNHAAQTCFQCKRGFHVRCAQRYNNHAGAGSCGRTKCVGAPPLVAPKPIDQQPPRAPEFSESQLPSTSKRCFGFL